MKAVGGGRGDANLNFFERIFYLTPDSRGIQPFFPHEIISTTRIVWFSEGSFRGPAWITPRKLAKIMDGVDQLKCRWNARSRSIHECNEPFFIFLSTRQRIFSFLSFFPSFPSSRLQTKHNEFSRERNDRLTFSTFIDNFFSINFTKWARLSTKFRANVSKLPDDES